MLRTFKYWYIIGSVLVAVLVSSCGKSVQVSEYAIIPEPVYMVQKARTFTLTPKTRLCFENLGQNTPTAKYIATSLRQMHVRPAFIGKPEDDCLTITLNDTVNPAIGDEGYLLQVRPEGIFLSANTEAGLFYAFQTFLQMLPADVHETSYKHIVMPECTILDYPRFAWRGSHLDVCRHFFTVKQIEKHLDLMAAYKLNKFHWHLSDDQGWRIEIEQYPALNDVGSWRVDRSAYQWGTEPPARPGEEPTYGGFYTKKQIAEIVSYAAQRNIEVVPEIELPGHCSAMLAAYPELSCDHGSYAVAIGPADSSCALLCVGDDSVLEFLYNVLDEVAEIFPGEYIHIGCGQGFTDSWRRCAKCQARKRANNLSSDTELCGWFAAQVADHLAGKGKRIIGWESMLDYNNLSTDAAVVVWSGDSCTASAAIRGSGVVVALPEYCDLASYQADSAYHPRAVRQLTTLRKCYQFDPMPKSLTSDALPWVWGGECMLRTDYILDYAQAEYFLLPRLCAVAECLWSPLEAKNWGHFRHKVEFHKTKLFSDGYAVCSGSFKPVVVKRGVPDGIEVTLDTEVEGAYIYYTTDGSTPTPDSPVYTRPLVLPHGTKLRTLTLYRGEVQEGVWNFLI